VEVPLVLQFSIALFIGMVAATFVPPVRRAIPRPVEVLLWIALVTVCVLGVASITDPNARELSTSAAWGADQIINTIVSLALGGVGAWILEHRFAIASWMILIAGADIFTLMFLTSLRRARPWQPRVRLREWMELPLAETAVPQRRQLALGSGTQVLGLTGADPLAGFNRRLAAASAVASTAVLAKMVDLSIWVRDVVVPREARRLANAATTGRMESRARLESLREATAHLQYAARAWYVAAGEPAVSGLGVKASGALGRPARAAKRGLAPVATRASQVIDIQALLSAQSLGWYGPLGDGLTNVPGEEDDAKPQRSDRLAS
jgi:hypothetical protein